MWPRTVLRKRLPGAGAPERPYRPGTMGASSAGRCCRWQTPDDASGWSSTVATATWLAEIPTAASSSRGDRAQVRRARSRAAARGAGDVDGRGDRRDARLVHEVGGGEIALDCLVEVREGRRTMDEVPSRLPELLLEAVVEAPTFMDP